MSTPYGLCLDMGMIGRTEDLFGHTNWVWSVSVSPDGGTIASSSLDGSIRLWSSQTGECLAVLTAPDLRGYEHQWRDRNCRRAESGAQISWRGEN